MGDTRPRLVFDAVENQVLRRWTHGPPSPGVIRTTAKNRFDSQPHRMAITIDAAPALAAPPELIYLLSMITALTSRSRQGRPPRRRHTEQARVRLCNRATVVWLRRRDV